MKTAIQLYSVRDGLLEHLRERLTAIKEIGYDGVEIHGLGRETVLSIADEMKRIGLEVFSIHTDLNEVMASEKETLRAYAAVGCKYMPICWLPETHIAGGDDYIEMLGYVTKFSALDAKYGIRILYHNHDFDLALCGDTMCSTAIPILRFCRRSWIPVGVFRRVRSRCLSENLRRPLSHPPCQGLRQRGWTCGIPRSRGRFFS